jgi:hypothetical protein
MGDFSKNGSVKNNTAHISRNSLPCIEIPRESRTPTKMQILNKLTQKMEKQKFSTNNNLPVITAYSISENGQHTPVQKFEGKFQYEQKIIYPRKLHLLDNKCEISRNPTEFYKKDSYENILSTNPIFTEEKRTPTNLQKGRAITHHLQSINQSENIIESNLKQFRAKENNKKTKKKSCIFFFKCFA